MRIDAYIQFFRDLFIAQDAFQVQFDRLVSVSGKIHIAPIIKRILCLPGTNAYTVDMVQIFFVITFEPCLYVRGVQRD